MRTCVLDVGSHTLKAGPGDAEEPVVVVPSLSGTYKYKPVFSTLMEHRQISADSVLVGKTIEKNKGVVSLHYPIQHSVINDWKAGSLLIQQALEESFYSSETANAKQNAPHSSSWSSAPYCYALVEPPFASRVQRKKIVEELLEYRKDDEVYGVFVGVSPLLALYSSGQLSGVALDVGEGQVSTAAAINGFSVPSAMQRQDEGTTGEAVTTYLESLLRMYGTFERSIPCNSTALWSRPLGAGTVADHEVVRAIKERRCEVSPSAFSPLSVSAEPKSSSEAVAQMTEALHQMSEQNQAYPLQTHRLPDGSEIEVGVEALLAPEVLFNPSLIGSESRGLCNVVLSTVGHVDMEARTTLLGHVVVSGGTTLMNGFGARFLKEMVQRVPRDNKVRVVAPAHRAFAPWLGAAFLSQLSTFSSGMVVTRMEYEEAGESALQTKLFV